MDGTNLIHIRCVLYQHPVDKQRTRLQNHAAYCESGVRQHHVATQQATAINREEEELTPV